MPIKPAIPDINNHAAAGTGTLVIVVEVSAVKFRVINWAEFDSLKTDTEPDSGILNVSLTDNVAAETGVIKNSIEMIITSNFIFISKSPFEYDKHLGAGQVCLKPDSIICPH
ncbi:MAG: hypothetical protein OEZ38_14710 [Gammaproteobacteria bacterium]|nr:hypothetical protein [Gammaproteobacteria bacterium]